MTSTVSMKPASSALRLFDDQSFSFETLRALGYAPYGGADIGEVTSTADRIPYCDKTPSPSSACPWTADHEPLVARTCVKTLTSL